MKYLKDIKRITVFTVLVDRSKKEVEFDVQVRGLDKDGNYLSLNNQFVMETDDTEQDESYLEMQVPLLIVKFAQAVFTPKAYEASISQMSKFPSLESPSQS